MRFCRLQSAHPEVRAPQGQNVAGLDGGLGSNWLWRARFLIFTQRRWRLSGSFESRQNWRDLLASGGVQVEELIYLRDRPNIA